MVKCLWAKHQSQSINPIVYHQLLILVHFQVQKFHQLLAPARNIQYSKDYYSTHWVDMIAPQNQMYKNVLAQLQCRSNKLLVKHKKNHCHHKMIQLERHEHHNHDEDVVLVETTIG